MSSRRPKKPYDGRRYAGIPWEVLDSEAFKSLKGYSVKLLLNVVRQFSGFNNGDLFITWDDMALRGWRSRDTLNKARIELLSKGFLAETRKGARPHKATLYGLLWRDLNDCRDKKGAYKLDISPVAFAKLRGAYNRPPVHFDKTGSNFGHPPAVPQTPARRAIKSQSATTDTRPPCYTGQKTPIQTPARRAPLYITKGVSAPESAEQVAVPWNGPFPERVRLRQPGSSIDIPGTTPLSGGAPVPGTVMSSGAVALPSARIVIAMLAAGWLATADTEPPASPSRQIAVELAYEPADEPIPDYDRQERPAYEDAAAIKHLAVTEESERDILWQCVEIEAQEG